MIQAGGIPPVPAAEQAPLLIARQGSFAVGGNILQRPGTYDNSRFPGWGKKPWIVPIPGTRKFSRLKENAEAAHVILSADEVRQIDAALSFMNMSDVFGGSPITEKSSTH